MMDYSQAPLCWCALHVCSQIAIEGCAHGELDSIYASLALTEQQCGAKVDLLLICGDFQAVRNAADLSGMACPAKYRAMQSFYKYYSGELVAPCLTIFVGGNHEASSHLCSLPYGGWVAPNIFFLGNAGVVNVGGIRIGGLSGIYNQRHYHLGHYEMPPFSEDDMRSIYHIRELDVMRLMQLRRPMDIFLSHDWPQHIARHGDLKQLLRRKAFLQHEIDDGSLGSPPAMALLQQLKPRYWFSAHLHVKYAAVVHHPASDANLGPREGSATSTVASHGREHGATHDGGHGGSRGRETRFLSLSKCLPGHDFLQLLHVEGDGSPPTICYDAEWLAVLRSTQHLHSSARERLPLDAAAVAAASGGRTCFTPTAEEESQVYKLAPAQGVDFDDAMTGTSLAVKTPHLTVPLNFTVTATAYRPGEPIVAPQASFSESPQTTAFVQAFGLAENFRTQRSATQGQRTGFESGRIAQRRGGHGGSDERMSMQLPVPSLPVPPSSLFVPPSSLPVPPSSLPVPPSSHPLPPSSLQVQSSSFAWAATPPFVPGPSSATRPHAAEVSMRAHLPVPVLDEEIDVDDD